MAIETIENVQTIQLLTRETEFCDKFRMISRNTKSGELSKGRLEAINFAVSQSFMYFVISFSYALGLYLISEQIESADVVFQ